MPVDAVGIAMSTIQVVLAPIVVGMSANKFFPKAVKKLLPVTPLIGIFATCMVSLTQSPLALRKTRNIYIYESQQ